MKYKITFNLKTPISFIDKPKFDGLLAYCYAKDLLQEKFVQKLSYLKTEQIDFSKMPIEICTKTAIFWQVLCFLMKT